MRVVQGVVQLLVCWLLLGPVPVQAGSGPVDLNTATVKELETLPFIGEGRARAIVRYRESKGGFGSVEELKAIPDIGDSTFQAIQPYLTLSGGPSGPGRQDPSAVKFRPLIVTRPGEVRLLTDQDYYPTLEGLIAQATSSIDLVMFLFKTTAAEKNRAAALVQELVRARQRGVRVTVLLERSGYDPELNRENEQVGARLKKGGITVRFDSKKTTTHAKAVVIDRRYTLIGSHNFTGSALTYNHEASLLVDSQALASQLLEYMGGIK